MHAIYFIRDVNQPISTWLALNVHEAYTATKLLIVNPLKRHTHGRMQELVEESITWTSTCYYVRVSWMAIANRINHNEWNSGTIQKKERLSRTLYLIVGMLRAVAVRYASTDVSRTRIVMPYAFAKHASTQWKHVGQKNGNDGATHERVCLRGDVKLMSRIR